MSTYAIIHKQTEQVSPDDWEVRTYTLQVDESTTIGPPQMHVEAIRSTLHEKVSDLKALFTEITNENPWE